MYVLLLLFLFLLFFPVPINAPLGLIKINCHWCFRSGAHKLMWVSCPLCSCYLLLNCRPKCNVLILCFLDVMSLLWTQFGSNVEDVLYHWLLLCTLDIVKQDAIKYFWIWMNLNKAPFYALCNVTLSSYPLCNDSLMSILVIFIFMVYLNLW